MGSNLTKETSYTQAVFRILLDCMARPGKIAAIEPAVRGFNFCFNAYILGVAITLLDQEVSFCIHSDRHNSAIQLQMYTLSHHASLAVLQPGISLGIGLDFCRSSRAVMLYSAQY